MFPGRCFTNCWLKGKGSRRKWHCVWASWPATDRNCGCKCNRPTISITRSGHWRLNCARSDAPPDAAAVVPDSSDSDLEAEDLLAFVDAVETPDDEARSSTGLYLNEIGLI